MQSRQLAAPYHLHSCRAAQQSAQLHDAHSNFKALLCAVPSVEGSKKAAIGLLTYAQQTTGCTVPPNYHQRIVICKMSLAHSKGHIVGSVKPKQNTGTQHLPVQSLPTSSKRGQEMKCFLPRRGRLLCSVGVWGFGVDADRTMSHASSTTHSSCSQYGLENKIGSLARQG